jgi:hypothetical protein
MQSQSRSVVAMGYDAVYDAMPKSPTLRRLWRELALGVDFPEEFLHRSFVTLPQLWTSAAEWPAWRCGSRAKPAPA